MASAPDDVLEILPGNYEANFVIDRWQLSYDAKPSIGIGLSVGGTLCLCKSGGDGHGTKYQCDFGDLNLCKDTALSHYLTDLAGLPDTIIGRLNFPSGYDGVIILPEGDPLIIYNLLEAGKELTLILEVATTADERLHVSTMHFYEWQTSKAKQGL
jgi:hypothetical protein